MVVGVWSLGSWLVLAVSYYTVLRSLGIPSPARAAVLSLVTNLVQVIPASAASLGVFEAAGPGGGGRLRRRPGGGRFGGRGCTP